MDRPTVIEFYREGSDRFIVRLEAQAVPRQGEFVNINGETFQVSIVTWAVDTADRLTQLRANVNLVSKAEG